MAKYDTAFTLVNTNAKPKSVSNIGVVTFNDGTSDFTPNRIQCEQYGYTFDVATQTCRAFTNSNNLNGVFANAKNNVQGTNNFVAPTSNNVYIMGQNNNVNGLARNNIVIGESNQINDSVNNVHVSGALGEATATNSLVIGGNAGGDNLGERQSIQLLYGLQTTAGGTTSSFLNNTTDSYFVVPSNTAIYFHADILAVRVGGTGTGTAGDFASWVERGVVINKSGTLSIERERDTIKSSGTVSNWRPTAAVDGTNFKINVRGATDVTIEWCSNITMTQIKTGVTL